MRRSATLITLFATGLFASQAFACGESLFRLGRGVTFREYTAPLPGNLLVVARTDSERAMAERLAAAGHDVHVVSDPSEIGATIRASEHPFDIVLAYFAQRDVVEAETASTAAVFLPVAVDDAEETRASADYGHVLLDQDSIKRFLRTINSVLRGRA